MIRHIVAWKLTAEDAEGKAASIAAMAGALEPLAAVIGGIVSLTVRPNVAHFDANWDVVLVGDYESLDALDAYQVHPEHVAAVAIVRQHTAQRVAVDYEL